MLHHFIDHDDNIPNLHFRICLKLVITIALTITITNSLEITNYPHSRIHTGRRQESLS